MLKSPLSLYPSVRRPCLLRASLIQCIRCKLACIIVLVGPLHLIGLVGTLPVRVEVQAFSYAPALLGRSMVDALQQLLASFSMQQTAASAMHHVASAQSRCLLCIDTCARQVVVEAEAYSNAPGLLKRGLAELLQHLLATFSTILQEQLPGETLRPGSL